MSIRLYGMIFAMVLLLAFAEIAVAQAWSGFGAPSGSETPSSSEEKIVANVWADANADKPISAEAGGELLSRDFAAAGVSATGLLTEWQEHLAYSLQNGYPVSELATTLDRNRAADSLRLAALAAANGSDRKALQELVTLFNNLRLWSDGLVEAQRDLRLAQSYMSPTALNDDTLFRKIAGCEAFLAPMLTSRRLEQDPLCE